MEETYDNVLLGILQHEGKVEKFLNVVFGFLYRRTDYYRLMKTKDEKLGFPPGVALNLLTNIFHNYDAVSRKDDILREARNQELERKKQQDIKQESLSLGQLQERTVQSRSPLTQCESTSKQTVLDSTVAHDANSKKLTSDASANGDSLKSTEKNNPNKCNEPKSEAKCSEGTKTETKSNDEEEDSELTRQQKKFQENPESYNGAERENYSWAQSITDLDLRVKVPSYIRKGRDVKVEISKKHVKVEHKDESGQFIVVVDGDLTLAVQKEECMWTLNPGENILINFEKKDEKWWEAVLVDEPKISVRKIDASRPMSDLDDEAQAKIEEMVYNDRLKKLGLPTAKEQKVQDMLKNAWDAEGSPFKGQPFDPSKFSVDPNGTINMKPS